MTEFEHLVLAAIGTGLTGVGSLVVWVVKSVVPKFLGIAEERNRLSDERNKTLIEAVQSLGKAVIDLEKSLEAEAQKVLTEVRDSRDKVLGRIDDKRIDELAGEFRKSFPSSPDDTRPPDRPRQRKT